MEYFKTNHLSTHRLSIVISVCLNQQMYFYQIIYIYQFLLELLSFKNTYLFVLGALVAY
jgi:hypothetical protein